MKMQFEIDLNEVYADYEGENFGEILSEKVQKTIENGIEEKVINKILSKFENQMDSKIKSKLSDISSAIDERAESILDDFLNRKVNVTDRWGDVVKSNVSVVDLMKEKYDNFIDEKVDNEGKVSQSYGSKRRIDYIIDKKFSYQIDRVTDKITNELQKRIKEEVEGQLGRKISNKLLNELNILGDK